MSPARSLVAAIPVRNEADRIGCCLRALATQQGTCLTHAVLLINNSTDSTADRVRAVIPCLPFRVCVVERTYPSPMAHAGTARSDAMKVAAAMAGPDGILLTTDADGVVAPDWLARNLAALDNGADAVCGRALIDPAEARLLPACLHDDDRAEMAYATMLDHIHDLIDPDPHDPWPRHTEHSGASIAVRVGAWRQAGGVPPLPLGEDRGFLMALRNVDAAIRHAPDVMVTVSGRTVGRARGGMADTMARRLIRHDEMLDESLEPATTCLHRAQARAALRRLRAMSPSTRSRHEAGRRLARQLGLPLPYVIGVTQERFFGMAWSQLETASPDLRRMPVRRCELDMHVRQAERIMRQLLASRSAACV
ncbi:glycosyltransferase [Novacetimonas pomaceti]|uniref:glycosyltransferase n=1 Tax=Novacetimonas pomaceti TaxID=2021998 RepID=UPI001C2D5BA0|nr:glycosyltransferase family A protein [Novacetimonas pomaceti]MBV1833660.1 glycosyltransferase family 2 protein [Novacetimonas pomaceti]